MSNPSRDVFVITNPTEEIVFYADDQASHKQVLTIMNNYQFPLTYQITIQSSDESKYSLSEHQKLIQQNYYAEIIIHHKSVTPANFGITDKLIIFTSNKAVPARGKKELSLTLLATRPCSCRRADIPSPSIEPVLLSHQQHEPRELHNPAQERRRDVVSDEVRREGDSNTNKFIAAFVIGVISCYLCRLPPGGVFESEFITRIQDGFIAFISGVISIYIWKLA